MVPLVAALIILVLVLIYAVLSRKTESFEDSLSSQPPEIVNLVMITKDIPNAAPRAMAIFQQFQEKKVSADEAIQQLYAIFKEGEAAHKKMMTKPYESYFTDALDFASKAMDRDTSVPVVVKSSVKAAIQKFKAQMVAASPAATVSTLSNVAAAAAVAPAPSESPIAANAAGASAAPAGPSMPAPSDARTVALINQQLKVMGIKANGANMKAIGSATAGPDSDATEQGIEYDNLAHGPADKRCPPARPSCPEDNSDPSCEDSSPAPVDMNKYIRKDSIPCWGCTLPTTP